MNEKLKAILAELRSRFEEIYGDRLVLEFRLRRQGAPHWETVIRAKKSVKFASANRE